MKLLVLSNIIAKDQFSLSTEWDWPNQLVYTYLFLLTKATIIKISVRFIKLLSC